MVSAHLIKRFCRIGLFLMVCVLWNFNNLNAESVGSPAGILKKGKWIFGLDATTLQRTLEVGGGMHDATLFSGGHFRGYGLTDWLSIYGRIGGGRLEVEDGSSGDSFGGALFLSGQVKGRLWKSKTKDWEWDGSVKFTRLRSRHSGSNEGDWNGWQFATSLAKGFGRIKPYGGVKLSFIDFDFTRRKNEIVVQTGTYEEDESLGFFLGTDFYAGRYEDVVINVETGYLDGAEASVSVAYIF